MEISVGTKKAVVAADRYVLLFIKLYMSDLFCDLKEISFTEGALSVADSIVSGADAILPPGAVPVTHKATKQRTKIRPMPKFNVFTGWNCVHFLRIYRWGSCAQLTNIPDILQKYCILR